MKFAPGTRVTWHCLTFGLRSGVVISPPCGRTTRVRCDDTSNHELIPTHWLASTGEYVEVDIVPEPCEACEIEQAGLAVAVFSWERLEHTCQPQRAA